MDIIVLSKEKLVGKPIEWKEAYTEKTQYLKDQFEDVIGKGSYFRFEGKNTENGDEYYCIIGPAKIRTPIAKFFAGVRKLPATYSAGGKYFDSLDSAANYAHETWGTPLLKEMKPYTSAHLYRIADRIEKWKRRKERKEEREKRDDLDDKEAGNFSCYRFAMAKPQVYRQPYKWWNYEVIKKYLNQPLESVPENLKDSIRQLQSILSTDPAFSTTLLEAENFHELAVNKKANQFYGLDPETASKMQKTFIGHHPVYGHYILSIGPYLGTKFEQSFGRFGYYKYKQAPATIDDIVETGWDRAVSKYKKEFGVDLDIGDLGIVFKGLRQSSLLNMKPTETSQLTINSLAWKLPLPSSYALFMKYKGLVNKFKGQYGEKASETAITRLAKMYHVPQDQVIKEISYGTKFRSQEDKTILEVANQKRMEDNFALNPDAYAFSQLPPIVRIGGEFELNNKGYAKIINHYVKNIGFEPYMEKGIKDIFSGRDTPRKKLIKYFGTEDNLRQLLQRNDPVAVEQVYKKARKVYNAEKEQGIALPIKQMDFVKDRAAINKKYIEFLDRPLDYGKFNLLTHYGVQQFSTIPGNDQQINQLELRKEIVEALMRGARTIKDIQKHLNWNIKRQNERIRHQKGIGQAEPEVPHNFIMEELQAIKEMAKDNDVTDFSKLVEKINEQINGLPVRKGATEETTLGFPSFKDALLMASLYFTSDIPVDPRKRAKYLTRAKQNTFIFNDILQDPDFENFTQEQIVGLAETGVMIPSGKHEIEQSPTLTDIEQVENTYDVNLADQEQKEMEQEEQKTDETDDVPAEEEVTTPEEAISEIVIDPTETPQVPDIPAPEITEIKPSGKSPLEPEIPSEEKSQEVEGILAKNPELESQENIANKNLMSDTPVKKDKRLDKAFKDTISQLIKIAKELDDENKGDAAEEIHKVIRKYQGRIF